MIEILIKLDKGKVPEKAKRPPLEDRVDHAIDCITCDVNKAAAIKFLQAAQVHLDGLPRQTKERQILLEKITNAISPYGQRMLPNKKEEK